MTKKPTHTVFYVKDITGEDGEPRSFWTKVGAAWANKDARGLSLVLDLLPVDGRLVVRAAVQEDGQEGAQQDAEAANP
jgi:hypothetical protein